jgi:hypothetical protein
MTLASTVRTTALAMHMSEDPDTMTAHDDGRVEVGKREYLVLTDEEADKAARAAVEDSLWAFNASFILDHMKYGDANRARLEKSIGKMQEELCEDAGPIVLAMIGGRAGFAKFADAAIGADGRGHFLSSYDGEERRVKVPPMEGSTHTGVLVLYVYRVN